MILKSFFRRKSTYIYLAILTIIYFMIFLLTAIDGYLSKKCNESYQQSSLIFIESTNDYYLFMKNEKNLTNIKRCLLLSYIDGFLDKNDLIVYDLDSKVIAYVDDSLNDDEISIYLNDNTYLNNQNEIKDNYKSFIELEFDNNKYQFKIKKIEKDSRNYVVLSKKVFSELSNGSIYSYTASMKDEKKENKMVKELYSQIDGRVDVISADSMQDITQREKIYEYVKILNIVYYIMCLTFVLITIVINKNIISDLKYNIFIEYRLGFRKIQIIFNLLKNLVSVYILSFIIPFILLLFFSLTMQIPLNAYIFSLLLFSFIEIIIISYIKIRK